MSHLSHSLADSEPNTYSPPSLADQPFYGSFAAQMAHSRLIVWLISDGSSLVGASVLQLF